mgnify:CR=1 FL=1
MRSMPSGMFTKTAASSQAQGQMMQLYLYRGGLFTDGIKFFPISGKNTTIGVVATNVKLTKAQATKVAGMAHDGLARCIRPIHTSLDGDTIFCLSTGELEFPENPVDTVGILAARVAEQAIIRAVKAAK